MNKERFQLLCLPSSLSPLSFPTKLCLATLSKLSFDLSHPSPGSCCSKRGRAGSGDNNPGRRAECSCAGQGNPWQAPHRRGLKFLPHWNGSKAALWSKAANLALEQPQLKPNPILGPLSEGQALQHLLVKHTVGGFNIKSENSTKSSAIQQKHCWLQYDQVG